ncbi:MAG: hypothetical protein BWX88_01932 [Planctomycetes bacterium ADurb.Bin126]|nr:MAG: hypothetical protein BWX88_01932 [Planctomycetes bacterium ADurb.Bin126]
MNAEAETVRQAVRAALLEVNPDDVTEFDTVFPSLMRAFDLRLSPGASCRSSNTGHGLGLTGEEVSQLTLIGLYIWLTRGVVSAVIRTKAIPRLEELRQELRAIPEERFRLSLCNHLLLLLRELTGESDPRS